MLHGNDGPISKFPDIATECPTFHYLTPLARLCSNKESIMLWQDCWTKYYLQVLVHVQAMQWDAPAETTRSRVNDLFLSPFPLIPLSAAFGPNSTSLSKGVVRQPCCHAIVELGPDSELGEHSGAHIQTHLNSEIQGQQHCKTNPADLGQHQGTA